jgi:hypothetical protein
MRKPTWLTRRRGPRLVGPEATAAATKEEKVTNIFSRNKDKDNGQVQVPEIEVSGDQVRVENPVENENQRESPDNTRFRLPKTKWFS